MTSTPPMRPRTNRGRRRDTLATRHVPNSIGTLTVTLLAVLTIVAWWLPGSRWSVGPIVALASFLLALGWPAWRGCTCLGSRRRSSPSAGH